MCKFPGIFPLFVSKYSILVLLFKTGGRGGRGLRYRNRRDRIVTSRVEAKEEEEEGRAPKIVLSYINQSSHDDLSGCTATDEQGHVDGAFTSERNSVGIAYGDKLGWDWATITLQLGRPMNIRIIFI